MIKDLDAGEKLKNKLSRLTQQIKLSKADYLFTTASENIAWLLNLRGKDNPHSPIPNCKIILMSKKCVYFFSCPKKNFLMKKILSTRVLYFVLMVNFLRLFLNLKVIILA